MPGIRKTWFQTKAAGIKVPPITSPSAFSRLQGGQAGLGTLICGRGRRFGHGFAQAFPHLALFFDEAFDGLRPDTLGGVLLKPLHDLLELSGVIVQVLFHLLLFLGGQTHGTSRTGVVVQADKAGMVSPINPG